MIAWILILVGLAFDRSECIVARGETPAKTGDEAADKAGDAHAQQSISRGFSYEDHGHLGYGLGQAEGYAEGFDHYAGNYEAEKYYGYDDHYKHEHKHDPGYHKALAIKGLLIPLAGVALLGAAAAFVSNPILLQLGVISSTYGRRKRDVEQATSPTGEGSIPQERFRDIQLLERFVAQVPKDEMRSQEEKLFADYLTCSGATTGDSCLERLACELHSPAGRTMPVETNVMTVVTNEILGNRYVPGVVKTRILKAVHRGRIGRDCGEYECRKLSALAASTDRSIRI